MSSGVRDLIIIGSGPATPRPSMRRAQLEPVLIEGAGDRGALMNTTEVENFRASGWHPRPRTDGEHAGPGSPVRYRVITMMSSRPNWTATSKRFARVRARSSRPGR
jgi:hypothetical protein